MSYNDNATPKYPGAIPDLKTVKDQAGRTLFETTAWPVNEGDESHTVPGASPYAIRLRYVPEEVRDASGYPIGVAIAGLVEMAWGDSASPTAGKYMVNYINGEVKFNSAQAGLVIQPAYNGIASWFWAEDINDIKRELKKALQILGVNVQGGFLTVKDRFAATETEIQSARGGLTNLDARFDYLEGIITPMATAQWTNKQPSAQTGVIASTNITLACDLYLDAATVSTSTVKLKNSLNQDIAGAVALGADKKTITFNPTNNLPDEVYTAYTVSGIKDALGRDVPTTSWSFGVGAAVANDKPNIVNFEVLNPKVSGNPDQGLTVKGNTADTENDTITRIDIGYSQTNNPATAVIIQLAGADIDAFKSANGKRLNPALAAGNWFSWARAVEQMQGGATQVGDWCTAVPFAVSAHNGPSVAPTITAVAGNLKVTVDVTNETAVQDSCSDGATVNSGTGAGYKFYYSQDNWQTSNATATIPLSSLPYDITGLTNGVAYKVKCEAVDTLGGVSAQSAEASATPSASPTIQATSSGKIYYKDFNDCTAGQLPPTEDSCTWYEHYAGTSPTTEVQVADVSGTKYLRVKKSTNVGWAEVFFPVQVEPVYIGGEYKHIDANSVGHDFRVWAYAELGQTQPTAFQDAVIYNRGVGVTSKLASRINNSQTVFADKGVIENGDTSLHKWAMKLNSDNVATYYEDGSSSLSGTDTTNGSTITDFNAVALQSGGDVDDGALHRRLFICKGFNVRVTGVPNNCYARVGGASGVTTRNISGSTGNVDVDMSGHIFPLAADGLQDKIEVLDTDGVTVLATATFANGVFGGDVYAYA